MLRAPLLLLACACIAAGCAPEANTNRAATGFNGFVDLVARACAPIQLGQYQLANPLMGGAGNNSYDFWLDQTSRLYYRRISPAQYRESLNGFFGTGNDATIDCLLSNLPPG
ncbi:MAG: hypothetical protein ABI624_07085 [Casimicrobiaceae bacterium]